MPHPPIVERSTWEAERAQLLAEEKEATRALDALAATRRRLPMTAVSGDHVLTGADGRSTLLGAFAGRRQLVLYHFMFPAGQTEVCVGCSSFVDNVGELAHLHARDTTFALTSPAPIGELLAYRERMGWTVPWYSANGTALNGELGVGGGFALSVLLREGDDVFLAYQTTGRGVDRLRLDFNLLDLTPFGRQETWEDSPAGWPQTAPYSWWRRHDEY